jgi:hypothetical protein
MNRIGKILAIGALIAAPLAVTAIPSQPANAQVYAAPGPYACNPYNPYYCPGYAYGYGYPYYYGGPYVGVGLGWGWGGGWHGGWHGRGGHFVRGGGRVSHRH